MTLKQKSSHIVMSTFGKFTLIFLAVALPVFAVLGSLLYFSDAAADGILQVEIIASYNLVVDSNVESPSTYAPSVATVIGKICNVGDNALTDVEAFIGDYASDTPGLYPARNSADAGFISQHGHLANTGLYALTHVGGQAGVGDASRYIGSLPAGECQVQYWHFTYPRRANPDNSGVAVWGLTRDPNDDLWLNFDVWATESGGGSANATWKVTTRNEISANANKIYPNGGVWFNTQSNQVQPGETITSNGVRYELGVINKGFDNDGDYVYDYNAWLQPVGDLAYDPSCFRLIRTVGVLTVSRSGGNPDMLIPFENQLYFSNLPEDNNGVVGNVHYVYLAMDGPCSTYMSPYQEVASGADNEKFNGDYGVSLPTIGSSEPEVTLNKASAPFTVTLGGTIDYTMTLGNQGSAPAGFPAVGVPLVVSDTIPAGTEYVSLSAGYTLNFNPNTGVTILYSTDGGATWSTTEPAPASNVTNIQWQLNDPLPAGASGNLATFQVTVPGGYSGPPFIENVACAQFGNGSCFLEDDTLTLLDGDNVIGDLVWLDEDNDGVVDGGETGIPNISVYLYWDADGDGALTTGDVLILSTTSDGAGAYSFDDLPDGDFLVLVDTNDPDLPNGNRATTLTTYAVTGLGTTQASPYLTADFGFGPVFRLDKTLISGDPAYEGDVLTYTIDLVNNRPGDGSGLGAACSYTVWANHVNDALDTPPSGTGNSEWISPTRSLQATDGLYAIANLSNNTNRLALGGFELGPQSGQILSVTMALYFNEIEALQNGDHIVATVYMTDSVTAPAFTYDGATDFIGGAGATYVFTEDITSNNPSTWDWSHFSNDRIELLLEADKGPGSTPGDLGLDGAAFIIQTDGTCGGSDDTIATLPLTDTYDADLLQFLSATPAQNSAATGGTDPYANTGTLTWDDLGPLFAGQTKVVTVTFQALEPPDNDMDGENDTATITNTALAANATFLDGKPVNPASDEVTSTLNPRGVISGTVWNDNGTGGGTASNGVQDGAELGIPGVTVHLYTDPNGDGNPIDGVLVSTTQTDEDGNYLFAGLADGDYVSVVDPTTLPGSSYTQTGDPDEAGACTTCDHQGGAGISNTNGDPSDDDAELNFGYIVPNALYGSVWEDFDGDGVQDPGDLGMANVTVELDNGSCTLGSDCATTTTGPDGAFSFEDLVDGTYTVYVITSTLPAGGTWGQTADPDATLDDRTTTPIVLSGGTLSGPHDFGYHHSGSATIGDTLYADWDGDGTQDSGEEGLPNINVYLYHDSDADGELNPRTDALIGTTQTNGSGMYLFSNLPAGDYLVQVDETDADFPSGYWQTEDPDEAGVCSVCDGLGSVTGVDGSSSYLDVDFGYQPKGGGSIGDFVWQDEDGDGIQDPGEAGLPNITVYLYEDSNNDGLIDAGDALVGTAVTDAQGGYLFADLPAAHYLVQVDTGDADLPTDGFSNPFVLSTGNNPLAVSLAASQAYTAADFGFTAGGTIGDFIWQDNDADGIQDGEEPGIGSVTVTLYNDVNGDGNYDPGTDTSYGTTTTNADGYYYFNSLPAGKYVVVVDTSDPDLPSSTITGDPDESGPCVTCDGETGVTLPAGKTHLGADFGFQTPGVVGDYVWLDGNQDGVQDPGEPGLSGVVITLTLQGGSALTTTTDADGLYSFGNVPDGNHTVEVDTGTLPAGLAQTYDPDQPGGTCTVCDHTGSVTVSGGSSHFNLDYGYSYNGPYSISGTVFHDDDGNGDHDEPGEGTYQGVTLYLWNSDGLQIGSTTTDASGNYTFGNLPNGSYTVSVNRNAPNLTGTSPTTATALPAVISGSDVTDVDFGFQSQVDMGDLPPSYGLTLLNDDGARHQVSSLLLGSSVDIDPDGQESAGADGDDNDGGDDDDGVAPTTGSRWQVGAGGGSVDVTVSGCTGTCYLAGWVDWNNDYDFANPGERILLDRQVVDGAQTITFDIPAGTVFGGTFNARFRLYPGSTDGRALTTGLAAGGEVEDYQWQFSPTAVALVSLSSRMSGQAYITLAVLLLGLGFGTGLWVWRRFRVSVREI